MELTVIMQSCIRRDNVKIYFTVCALTGILYLLLEHLGYQTPKYYTNIRPPEDAVRITRSYWSPLQVLVDQNPKWRGDFNKEIQQLKRSGKITDQVIFELFYKTDIIKLDTNITLSRPGINCAKLISGDPSEVSKVELLIQNQKKEAEEGTAEEDVVRRARKCNKYKRTMGYVTQSITKDEEDFPLAYSIVVYKSIYQAERLLHAIYRPQNYYCFHVDTKAKYDFKKAVSYIARCFENVFIVSKPVDVKWGKMTVLQADLNCMRDLWTIGVKNKKMWKYFINLTGQEFPLKTNWELVQILKSYKGAVDIGHSVGGRWNVRRDCPNGYKHKCKKMTPLLKSYNITFGKGPVHAALTSEFVDFCLYSKVSKEFLSWLSDKFIPDETYFPTLFLNGHLNIPGAYTGGISETDEEIQPLVRYKKWDWWRPCRGKSVRQICIMTIWDLPELAVRPEMFVNKFEEDYHPMAYDCLEELLWNRTKEDILAAKTGGMSVGANGKHDLPYTMLPWVQKHV